MPPLLAVALNGGREHAAMPRTPEEIATDARACVLAGATLVHVHAYDADGRETLEPAACAAAVRAARASGAPVSLTTSAAIEPDPDRRLALVRSWTELPTLVTANQGEDGVVDLCHHLLARGVGIEAGLLELSDAHAFVESGLAARCVRVLVEPLDADAAEAIAHAAAMEKVLADAGVALEQVHHGDGIASWSISERAVRRGHGMRTGLEDTPVLADGSTAVDNAALVREAVRLIARVRSQTR